jgi:hypothetical protein
MAESSPPKRRIFRWFVRTLVVVVLVPVLYLATYLSFNFVWGVGLVPPPVAEGLNDGFYEPFDWYIRENHPGSRIIVALRNMAGDAGVAVGRRIPK